LTKLKELQDNFQNYLLGSNSTIDTKIISSEKISAAMRLDIYRDGYFLRLLEVLQNDYKVLLKILGGNAFIELAEKYIAAHTSTYYSLRWFGAELANFMRTQNHYQSKAHLIELAEFEWLLLASFDAKNSPTATLEQMATVAGNDWPDMHFEVQAAMRLINFSWNTLNLWHACNDDNENLWDAEKLFTPVTCLIWRNDNNVQFYSLSHDEEYMINAMAHGENFANICTGLCEWIAPNEVAMHAALLLKKYIIDGLIAQINI
jgi:hypothetical protein